ncbi:MAG: hypothetical protein ACJAZP_003386 [Psychromonas sp.]|jgi:hypothetical protein
MGLTCIVSIPPLTARISHSLTLRGNVDAVLGYCKLSLEAFGLNLIVGIPPLTACYFFSTARKSNQKVPFLDVFLS